MMTRVLESEDGFWMTMTVAAVGLFIYTLLVVKLVIWLTKSDDKPEHPMNQGPQRLEVKPRRRGSEEGKEEEEEGPQRLEVKPRRRESEEEGMVTRDVGTQSQTTYRTGGAARNDRFVPLGYLAQGAWPEKLNFKKKEQ